MEEEKDDGCCVICAVVFILVFIFSIQSRYEFVLQLLVVFVVSFVGIIVCTCLVTHLRDFCLYLSLRYELYQLERYLERQRRVSIVPTCTPSPVASETIIVIQNPNHISLGYKSKPEV